MSDLAVTPTLLLFIKAITLLQSQPGYLAVLTLLIYPRGKSNLNEAVSRCDLCLEYWFAALFVLKQEMPHHPLVSVLVRK